MLVAPFFRRLTGASGRSFATWTCVLGDEVAGVWPKYANKDDINALDTAGDLGWARGYARKFPALINTCTTSKRPPATISGSSSCFGFRAAKRGMRESFQEKWLPSYITQPNFTQRGV